MNVIFWYVGRLSNQIVDVSSQITEARPVQEEEMSMSPNTVSVL